MDPVLAFSAAVRFRLPGAQRRVRRAAVRRSGSLWGTPSSHRLLLASLLLLPSLLSGCARTFNYQLLDDPRHAGLTTVLPRPDPEPGLRVVTFNVQHAERIPEAIRVLEETPELRYADIVFLQEMDAVGTEAIAKALGMHWVYYPASIHRSTDRDFGNAILARWPIRNDRKILLPNLAIHDRSQRIAVTGTVEVEGLPIHLYSVHFAMPFLVSASGRREQAETTLRDADWMSGPVIVAGDFNSGSLGEVFEDAGYSWPTRGLGPTVKVFGVDHILARGLDPAADLPAGVVRDQRGASDHRPVWALFRLSGKARADAAP